MKKGLCIILIAMLLLLLSGCWSRQEPKTLALINSVIYDFIDTGGYQVTVEVINPSSQDGGKESGKSSSIIVTNKGPSLPEAIRNVSESLDRTIFGGHNKVRFFTEKFAKRDIISIMDYLLRDRLTDENPLMVVIKHDDPGQIYSSMLGLSETVGDYIDGLSETQPATTSKAVFVKTLDFLKDYYDKGKQPVAGVVELVEPEPQPTDNAGADAGSSEGGSEGGPDQKYKTIYTGLAAFKDTKLVGYMDDIETRAYNFITNNIERAIISLVSGNSETVAIVQDSKAEIKTEIENGQITVNVKVKNHMAIIQASGAIDISKTEPLKTVEADFNQQIAKEINAAIQKAQHEFQSDIFGFGVFVHRDHPKEWKEIKENWDDYFSKAVINVSVESIANRSGAIKQPFSWELE